MQTAQLSKTAYAKRYDDMADRLYRLSLYLLGEVESAQQVMASLFVEGFSAYEQTQFESAMLKLLWQLVKDRCPVRAEQYCKNLKQAGVCGKQDETCVRLLNMLGAMPLTERATLLLSVMQGLPQPLIAWVLELTPQQVDGISRKLFSKMRHIIPL